MTRQELSIWQEEASRMKRILIAITAALLWANFAHAQTIENDLVGLGMPPEQAEYLASVIPLGSTFSNAAWHKWRNAADTADINAVRVDSSDDTWLNADTGDVIKLGVGGTAEVTIDNDSLTFSGASASLAFGATSGIIKLNGNTELTLTDDKLTFAGATTSELETGASFIINPVADANRLFTLGAASDTAHTISFGDAGVTATQSLLLSSSTPDADDDSTVNITGGGDFNASGTRGAYVQLKGNEASGAGDITIAAGAAAGSDITILPWATDGRTILGANGANRWLITSTGLLENDGTNGGNLNLTKAGTTVAFEEATAGSACSGTLTANGATPVVTSTTCAVTGARIFLSRTSSETGVVTAWVSAISNGVSFSVTGEAGDTGTYNWVIFHEAS